MTPSDKIATYIEDRAAKARERAIRRGVGRGTSAALEATYLFRLAADIRAGLWEGDDGR